MIVHLIWTNSFVIIHLVPDKIPIFNAKTVLVHITYKSLIDELPYLMACTIGVQHDGVRDLSHLGRLRGDMSVVLHISASAICDCSEDEVKLVIVASSSL